jgi:RNA ligase (TIGR02306 family)
MSVAVVGLIEKISEIENADRLQLATVNAGDSGVWEAVVRKGDFDEDELVETYLQDALLPADDPRFDFMEPRGYRVRMARLRGVPSECLVMKYQLDDAHKQVGLDIADYVGVTKYEKPIPESMGGMMEGSFPFFIPKTDEPNFQSVPEMVAELGELWHATEKADGTSCTVYRKDDHFGVCSRNWKYKDTAENVYWQMARKYNLEDILAAYPIDVALQFEIVGPGIQGNPMGLDEKQIRAFDLYDIEHYMYLSRETLETFCIPDIPMVPVVYQSTGNEELTPDFLRELAKGEYSNGKPREGIVIRPDNIKMLSHRRVSFKVINLDYKD